eukprot:TRINITY_DN934_c0_g1_i5.p1 TRINITY_DN934_c0_g1~~TRINITY_DN934_c0_g1_i5.p1  ORF type:complete len:280 (+),score=101.70 TRINITY_DN934_c0_g1_i5:128-841(+)
MESQLDIENQRYQEAENAKKKAINELAVLRKSVNHEHRQLKELNDTKTKLERKVQQLEKDLEAALRQNKELERTFAAQHEDQVQRLKSKIGSMDTQQKEHEQNLKHRLDQQIKANKRLRAEKETMEKEIQDLKRRIMKEEGTSMKLKVSLREMELLHGSPKKEKKQKNESSGEWKSEITLPEIPSVGSSAVAHSPSSARNGNGAGRSPRRGFMAGTASSGAKRSPRIRDFVAVKDES